MFFPVSSQAWVSDAYVWIIDYVIEASGQTWSIGVDAETLSIVFDENTALSLNKAGPVNFEKGIYASSSIASESLSAADSFAGTLSGKLEFDEKSLPASSSSKTPLEYAYVELEWLGLWPPAKSGSVGHTCEAPSICTTRTDANGNYVFSNLDGGQYRLVAKAETQWSKMLPGLQSASDYQYSIELVVNGSGTTTKDIYWNQVVLSGPGNHLGNLAHGMEEIHDYFKSSAFSYYSGWDSQMSYEPTANNCWAFALGSRIVMGSEVQQSKEAIYHEYSHNVIIDLYNGGIGSLGSAEGAAMDEGFADFFALSEGGGTTIADGINCGFPSRNIVNSLTMSDWSSTSPHFNGRIISGAVWDLKPGQRYASSGTSTSTVEKTLWEAFQANPRTFEDLGLEMEDYWLGVNPTVNIIGAIEDSWAFRSIPHAHKANSDVSESSTDQIVSDWKIQVYPNPVSGEDFTIELSGLEKEEGWVSVSIVDILGRTVRQLYEGHLGMQGKILRAMPKSCVWKV